MRFDRGQAANAIVERRKISFDINIHIGCARIDHRISLEDRHVLHLKKILLHCGLKNSQIDGLAGTQFGWIEFGQYIVEPSQPVKLRVEREPAVIGYFAVVFMKAESSSLERVGSEVGVDVIHGARFVLGVFCLCSEGRCPKAERQEDKSKRESFSERILINTGLQPAVITRGRPKPFQRVGHGRQAVGTARSRRISVTRRKPGVNDSEAAAHLASVN